MGERAGCFALFVFLVSCDCCVALPHDATGLSFVNMEFPDYTHLLFLTLTFGSILHTCEESVPNPHTCDESQLVVCIYQLWYGCKELETNAKCISFGGILSL